MNHNVKNFLLLLLLGCCWGPSFLFMKVAVVSIPPVTITAFRLLIGAVLLYGILRFKKISLPKPEKKWWHLFVAGLFQSAIPFTLFAWGEETVDSSMAAIISGASPLFTLILAHFYSDNDKINKQKLIGSQVGFVGIFILVFPSLIIAKAGFSGVLMVLLATSCYAIGFVYTKKYVVGFAPIIAPTLQLFFGFLFLLPFVLSVNYPTISQISFSAIFSVLALGVLGTALAFVLYYKILENTNSTYLSFVNYITPIIGAILGVMVLGEKLGWNSYLGCAMILCGVMIANGVIKFKSKNH